jgi:hypothetical protein
MRLKNKINQESDEKKQSKECGQNIIDEKI